MRLPVRILVLILLAGFTISGSFSPTSFPKAPPSESDNRGQAALDEFLATPGVQSLDADAWYEAVEKLQTEGFARPGDVLLRAKVEDSRPLAAALLILARSLGAHRNDLVPFLHDVDPEVVTAAALAMETPREELEFWEADSGRRFRGQAWPGLFFDCGMWESAGLSPRPNVAFSPVRRFSRREVWREPIATFFNAENGSWPRPEGWTEIRAELLRVRSSILFELIWDEHAASDLQGFAATVARDPGESGSRRLRAIGALLRIGAPEGYRIALEQLYSSDSSEWVDALFWRVKWIEEESIDFLDMRIETGPKEIQAWAISQRIWLEAGRKGTTDPRDPTLPNAHVRLLQGRKYESPFSKSDRAWLANAMLDRSPAVAHLALTIVGRARAEASFRETLAIAKRDGVTHVVQVRAASMLDRAR